MTFDPKADDLVLGMVGTGTMGRGIAQIAAAAGVTVLLHDARDGAAAEAAQAIAATFATLAGKGRMTAAEAEAAGGRLRPVGSAGELAPCHVVVEAIVETLEAKRGLFAALEEVVGPDCVLATNTSSLPVTAIAAGTRRPERVAGFHFFNPVPLMRIVEVIPGVLTARPVTEAMLALGRRLGHTAVEARDTPGFIVNHAGRGYGTEALRVLGEGVAEPAEIDRVLVQQAGFRMGPFELLDLIGIDISQAVMESIYTQYFHETRYRPSILPRQLLSAGLLGRKTGRGFYVYEGSKPVLPPEPAAPAAVPCPVWVSRRAPEAGAALAGALAAAGVPLDGGERPAAGSVALVAPLGQDATTAALAEGLDPTRTLAVDLLFGLEGRRVAMTTPVTSQEARTAGWAALAAGGHAVTVTHDSPGFIAQRVVACIVNIGCDIAQQRIASPADIDRAVMLGLGYPQGPLAMGDRLGPARILAVLEALLEGTGDQRYRPSPWLKRRARLGVALTTPEG
ncbi:3-hydroxyacyl-CoA dehydrogenase [Azospirillum thermophilum]|uniref:3-hydroxyacyl-CoA dehydrogenase n=1 Tax=Azospirillum thermophilum TaxID=2202148 RepID=A0A2S2CMX6_9PROT|nr:3-hydroxyacyl-CoA dehydrogenase [Azospirillum thermophilum]AWK85730.1 3-hydroxyacyl-CoA dehydrogenase [Azospirillum thermophilum]